MAGPARVQSRSEADPGTASADTDDLGAPLSEQDFAAAARLPPAPHHDPSGPHADPLETADLYEGDIVLGAADEASHNAQRRPDKLWPRGEIPYTIASGFSGAERAAIASAVLEIERNTCLRLRPLAPGQYAEHSFVHIVKGSGCYSWVGLKAVPGAGQKLSLGEGCVMKGIAEHELMHAAGFWHEQSRPDRDQYVVIHWDNVAESRHHNFRKKSREQATTLDEPYDISSIMHYGPHSFAMNWYRPTITPKTPSSAQMGQRDGMSSLDIRKINKLYNCDGTTRPPVTTAAPRRQCADAGFCKMLVSAGWCTGQPDIMARFCASAASAEQGGHPAEQGGCPAERAGRPADQGGRPAEQGGRPAEWGGGGTWADLSRLCLPDAGRGVGPATAAEGSIPGGTPLCLGRSGSQTFPNHLCKPL